LEYFKLPFSGMDIDVSINALLLAHPAHANLALAACVGG